MNKYFYFTLSFHFFLEIFILKLFRLLFTTTIFVLLKIGNMKKHNGTSAIFAVCRCRISTLAQKNSNAEYRSYLKKSITDFLAPVFSKIGAFLHSFVKNLPFLISNNSQYFSCLPDAWSISNWKFDSNVNSVTTFAN